MKAITEWTPFTEVSESAQTGWFEDTVPVAGAEALADAPVTNVVELDDAVRLEGLVDQTALAEISTDGLGEDNANVLGIGTQADAVAPASPTDGSEIVIFEFLV